MTEPGKLTFEHYELPEPGQGAILAKVIRTNICGSELHIWKGKHPTKKSGVMGHEMVGRIERLGPGVETDSAGEPIGLGDRVVAAYFLTCRKCQFCQQGQFALCANAYAYWVKDAAEAPHFHGSFATHYYIHPDQYVYKVPDNVPDTAAASVNCALTQVYYGLVKGGLRYGETVVLQGAGGLGLNAAAVAKEFGATVIVLDAVASRLDKAKQFGADHVIDIRQVDTPAKRIEAIRDWTGGRFADLALELSGVPDAFSEGIHYIRPGGRYVSIGNVSPGATTLFDPGLLTRKAIQIIPIIRYEPWYLHKALQFLSANMEKYPFADMLDAHFCLEDIGEALDKSANREVTRASIIPGDVQDA
ncbi:zinc-binding alcohol dehydrogenase [Paenibacillus thalictri]|uniref:Zinc-binding alcohol dehydrogenase n=2 Tax=Paenibacillus thalictri TaxID=2527873 RepID=A0A4Q9DPR2_9BACL|nr:zinc-binding alcohol dehydrogenase [Paenibacillus thalictri]